MLTTSGNSCLRPILIACVVVGVFLTTLVMYLNPSIDWFYEPVKSVVCQDKSTSSDAAMYTDEPVNGTKKKTLLLVWFVPFGQANNLGICKSSFKIDDCIITTDRKLYSKADGVFFHHRDIPGLSSLPQTRPPQQKWIWMNMESPSHTNKKDGMNDVFNLTQNYRLDSDIEARYGYLVTAENPKPFVLPTKDKLVCWIVSNYQQGHKRTIYYNELRKHIEVSVWGRAFGKYVSPEQGQQIVSSCKFYLSFENSIHRDYFTEKLFKPLNLGTIPIVLGPSRSNYEKVVPGDAFIHFEDFKTPKEMADYLHVLDKNQTLYMRYFEWRKHFKVKPTSFWVEHACRACDYLKTSTDYKAKKDILSWFWD